MKKILFSIFLLFFPFWVFAQNTENDIVDTPIESLVQLEKCSDKYIISGPKNIKVNTAHEFSMKLKSKWETELPFGNFSLYFDEKKIETQKSEREKFVYSFGEVGVYNLVLELDQSVHQCRDVINHEIHSFKEVIFYLGAEKSILTEQDLIANFSSKSVLLNNFFDINALKNEDSLSVWNIMGTSDIVVLNISDILGLFSDMEKLQRIKENSFEKTNFFIISNQSSSFLSKVLASSINNLGIKNLHIINDDDFSSLLTKWSYGDDRTATLGEGLSYEREGFVFSMNTVLQYLVYSGISYQFLGFLLVLALLTLVLNIFKQVIGFDVFMIHYPLFLALIFSQFGLIFTTSFIVIAIVSILLVRLITNKIQLLVNAKKAFLISMYILLIFLALGIDNLMSFNFFRTASFDSSISVIAIFIILFVVEKIFDNTNIFSKSGIIHLFKYILILVIAILIFSYRDLQYFLISYPDLIFLIVIANLLVGRYMGLQIMEYIRFSPILRNINEEE